MLKHFIKSLLCCLTCMLGVQITVVSTVYGAGSPNEIIDFQSPSDQRELVVDMIDHGFKRFTSKHYRIQNGLISVELSSVDFNSQASAMVKNVIWLNDLPFSELFEGFSESVRQEAQQLYSLHGVEVMEVNSSGSSISRTEFQNRIDLFQDAAFQEAIDFIDQFLTDEASEDLTGPYIKQQDFELDASEMETDGLDQLVLDLALFESKSKGGSRKRRNKNQFSERVVELLEENNRILSSYSGMFESLQRQIDEINERDYEDVREEIAEMRKIITELESKPSTSSSNEEDYVVYDKNEYGLNLLQKTKLNRFVVLMAKNPEKRLLVMGFADKSGNVEYNAWISQQRANGVRDYLLSMGVDSERIVVSYFGDTESTTSSAADRRVELSLIN